MPERSRSVVYEEDPRLSVRTLGDETAGRVLAVLAGVHGDEPEGPLAAADLLARLADAPLRGAVRVVTVGNPEAFAAGQRCNPADGANLARVFPGDASGEPTERIAAWLCEHLLRGADLLVDLHSAGTHYEMPMFVGFDAGAPEATAAELAAMAFGAPVVWRHPAIQPGRSLSAARLAHVPAIYVEGSGGGRVRGDDLATYRRGLDRLLSHLGILPADLGAIPPAEVVDGGDGNVDAMLEAQADGFCVTFVEVGEQVAAGQVVAEVRTVADGVVQVLHAPWAARVMMLRRTAPVAAGDGIAMLAPREVTA